MKSQLLDSEIEILAQLQNTPNATAAELAGTVKRKTTSVQHSLRKLREVHGLIVRPAVNSYALGIQNIAVFFTPIFESEERRATFIKAISDHPKIPWASECIGEFRCGLTIHCGHICEVATVLRELCEAGNISFADKHISPRVSYSYFGRGYLSGRARKKSIFENSYDGVVREIDEFDRAILRALTDRSFTSFREVARTMGVPPSTLDQRVRRLEKHGVINGHSIHIDSKVLGRMTHRVMIQTHMFTESDSAQFTALCLRLPQVVYMNETLGTYDRELVVEIADQGDLGTLIGEYYRAFGSKVRSVRTLVEARSLKWRLF